MNNYITAGFVTAFAFEASKIAPAESVICLQPGTEVQEISQNVFSITDKFYPNIKVAIASMEALQQIEPGTGTNNLIRLRTCENTDHCLCDYCITKTMKQQT